MTKRSILARCLPSAGSLAILLPAVLAVVCSASSAAAADEPCPLEIFEKRIMPIFKSPNPSSCTQCHLSGVELKKYIIPSTPGKADGHEKTFLSLRDQGLIDLKAPENSKILKFIQKSEENAEKNAAMIHDKVRQAEFAAFAEWLKVSCKDERLCNAPKVNQTELATQVAEPEVIRYTRKDRLLESFEKNIWAMRFRCSSCHGEGDSPQHQTFLANHGPRVAWIKKEGAQATMNYLIGSGLINVQNPEQSLLLLKGTAEVPHVGGGKMAKPIPRPKFHKGADPIDLGYQGFRQWLEDYAKVVKGEYRDVAGLPRRKEMFNEYGTRMELSFTNLPDAWANHLVQVNLYAWDDKKQGWETLPIAVSDHVPRRTKDGWETKMLPLNVIAEKGSERDRRWKRNDSIKALAGNRFLVQVYVDKADRIQKDWKARMQRQDYVGQMEIRGELPEEPPPATWKHMAQLIKDLDDAKFPVREQASVALKKLGPQVAPLLRQVLKTPPSLEMKQRCDRILAHVTALPAPTTLDARRLTE